VYTELLIGGKIDVDSKAIAADKEVDKTLLFMQAILPASENPKIPFVDIFIEEDNRGAQVGGEEGGP
jgi:hypothetical protein